MLQKEAARSKKIQSVAREAAGSSRLPASWAQQRLWFIEQLEGAGAAYNIPIVLTLRGSLDRQALQSALDALVQRHEILRTVFVNEAGDAMQAVSPSGTFALQVVDVSHLDSSRRSARIEQEKRIEAEEPFDLGTGPLIRGRLLVVGADEHLLLITMHHIVSDGWSMGVLIRDFTRLYRANFDASVEAPEALAIQYADYAHWQQRWQQGEVLEKQLAYWRERLAGAAPQVELPTDRSRPAVHSYKGATLACVLDEQLTRQVKAFARKHGLTTFMMLYAAWALLLSRLSGQSDIVIGTPVANRNRAELEPLIGFFVNSLILRVCVSNQMRVQDFLAQVRDTTLDAFEHQETPFEKIVEALQPQRSLSRHPIFQVMFALQNAPKSELTLPGLLATVAEGSHDTAKFDLTLSLEERDETIVGGLNYATDLFEASTIGRWVDSYRLLLRELTADGARSLGKLPLLSERERRQVIELFNATDANYPKDRYVHELFEAQVLKTPEALAAIHDAGSLTYAELNARANQLARHLIEQGVSPGDYVPVVMTRSVLMLTVQLALLKCGGVYVPIDPELPAQRREFMIRDCKGARIVSDRSRQQDLELPETQWLDCSDFDARSSGYSEQNLNLQFTESPAAYVMYTSGSTGVPKGVVVPHRAVNRLVINNNFARIESTDCLAHYSNPAFDASTFEIWGALLNGARLLIVAQADVLDPKRFATRLQEHHVTLLWMSVGLFNQYADALGEVFRSLRYLIVGGDALEPATIARVLRESPPQHLLNGYGPTECTTFSATYHIKSVDAGAPSIPIGHPLGNGQIYILDERREPVPIGVPGELYIGGAGVARGYLNRPELTEERFVPNPFGSDPTARLYKTGDLGRWRADGAVEFLGRNDDQVKIRGFRIELGEIEARLTRHAQVKEASVFAREDIPGAKQLVAYVVARDPATAPSVEDLRTHLKASLPDYMLPGALVLLESLPLTTNGKVDRRALPAPQLDAYMTRQYEPPSGEVEEILASIWQSLLRVERVGRHDNFFELGGHSLLVMQLMERLRRFGLSIEARRVFDSPTLADLAAALSGGVADVEVPPNLIPLGCGQLLPEMLPLVELEPRHLDLIARSVPGGAANIEDIYPLAPLQEGILFHHLLDQSGRDAYVLPLVLSVTSRVRLNELIQALQGVIDRHDVVRTAVLWEQLPRPVQVVYRQVPLPVEEAAFDPDRSIEAQIAEWLEPARQRLDLRQAPLMRLRVACDTHTGEWYALLQTHHITTDHVALEIVISEIVAQLEGRPIRRHSSLPYRNHVAQLLAYASTHDAEAFFKSKLGDIDEPTAPFGFVDVHGTGNDVAEAIGELPSDLAGQLRAIARRLGVSAATLFHAAWGLVVARTSGRNDPVFGSVLLGRLQANVGTQRALGLFINTLPLRLRLDGVNAKTFVEQTQRELVDLLGHEQASLAVAQRCSAIEGATPLFSTLLNYRHSVPNPDAQWASASGVRVVTVEERTNYPIACSVDDLGDGFAIKVQTDRRIDPKRMAGYLQTSLRSLVEALDKAPSTPVLTLAMLPAPEQQLLLEQFNATAAEYPAHKLIHELFEEQVERTPQAVAVIGGDQHLSYVELNAKANQLARYLKQQGVGQDRFVGLCVERGVDMVVGLLGILKSGGAYVPLDPSYPQQRLDYMLGDTAPVVVLTQEHLRERLPATRQLTTLDGQWSQIAEYPSTNLTRAQSGITSSALAYVIYTSGSTGLPKGVVIEHRNAVNLIYWAHASLSRDVFAQTLQSTSLNFDLSVYELFVPLSAGGSIRVVQNALMIASEPAGTTLINTVPSAIRGILDGAGIPETVRVVNLAGEALKREIVERIFAESSVEQVCNLYGPSETTTYSTGIAMPRALGFNDSIGRPLANTQVYILDAQRQLVPMGIVGEIYIGGDGVARGYLNRPELTSERFVSDPFGTDPGARMYRTGDVGRWREDGTIEYLGRNDHQVKIRGFRVELGEIEAQLIRQPGVKEAVVLAREDVPGEKRLVAYIVAHDGSKAPSVEELRVALKATLPEYMVPSAVVVLDKLPLTSNGKLDRKLLPAPELGAYVSQRYEAPQGEVEEILAGIWQSLLRVERVGRHDNFFELGGHSLLIMQMMERLRRVGLTTQVRRVFDNPVLADLAGDLASPVTVDAQIPPNSIPASAGKITPDMLPLVTLDAEQIDRIVRAVPGGVANVQDIYPLAPLQEGILFHHLLDRAGGDTYVLALLLQVESRTQLDDLVRSLQGVIDRHDALRTAVLWEELPQPVQVVCRRAQLPVTEVTLMADQDIDPQLRDWMDPSRQKVDLRHAPLMRLQIAQDPRGHWYALLQTHHIISDHIGLEIVTEEVMAQLQGRAHQLPMSSSYRNYVAQALAHARTQDVEGFFRSKLADVTETTAPFGQKNVRGDRAHIQEFHEQLVPALSQQTRALARRFGVSAATMFHAAWALVVAHTSGREDVVFGSVLLGRLQVDSDMQRTVGMFINTLPLRLKLSGLHAKDLLEVTQRELVELLAYEQASLAIAQRCSGVEGSSPLFTALLNYRHSKPNAHTQWNDLEGMRTVASQERTNYPIALSVDDLGEAFAITAQTDERIDPRRMTHYLIAALESLSVALEQAPKTLALNLTILPEHERRQVISLFNNTRAWYPRERTIHEVFEEQVLRSPGAVAVVHPGGTLTYSQLNGRANQLVRYLLEQGVATGDYVPVVMSRSVQMLVVHLALLKCGGVYLPIDPELPAERRMFMIRDCGARRIVSDRPQPQDLNSLDVPWIDCSEFDAHSLGYGTENLSLVLDPLPPAYVMYTSGSTGVPKGVVVPHHAVNRLAINNGYALISSADCIAHYSNPAFDASTFETWGALLNGARVLVVPQADVLEANKFAAVLKQHRVTLLYMSVGLFNQYTEALAEVFSGLRYLMVGGDSLEPTAIRRVLKNSPPAVFLNVYGPTECTTFSTRFHIESLDESAQSIPIGQPIANAQVYILNERREPVPVGVPGELYIGGDGVATGYLNRPELTEQRFVPDAFSNEPNAQLYKTGDLCRWRADGAIEFLGRNDNQVKIRGFRIELGEIEARLLDNTSLRSVFVVALGDGPGEKRLVAYVVPKDSQVTPTAEDLRTALKSSLPEYMLPSAFVTLDALPLNANGKVDRRALPAPDLTSYAQRQYEAPRGDVEEILAGLWQELLRVERVGRHDNFFELGGHSLLVVQMLERLRRVGLATEVRRIFDAATLADLASSLSHASVERFEVPANAITSDCMRITPELLPLIQLDQEQIDRIVASVPGGALNVQDIYPLAPLQEGMLFHHLLNREGGDAYVLPTVLAVPSRERLQALISALQATIDRHDILRTAVLWEDLPRPVQVVYRRAPIAVDEIALDLRRDALEQVSEWTQPERQRMDLRRAPLVRLQVAEDAQRGQLYVLLQLHHIVVDGTSFRAVLGEIISQLQGETQQLPTSVPYRAHVANALRYAEKNDAQRFFVGKLADVEEPTAPFGLLDVHGDGTQVDESRLELDAGFAQRLRRQAGSLGVSAATLFHSAWALVTAHTSGRDDVVFGTVLLGRMQSAADAQQMLGLFINTLPLRMKLQDLSAKALVQQTQRELLELMSHEQASLAVAQSCSGVSGNTPLFSALLNYRHGGAGAEIDFTGATGMQVLAVRNGTNYPITLSIDDLGQTFALIAQTDRRIDPRRINGYLEEALRSLVEALEQQAQRSALSLAILPHNERWQVLEQFNATAQPYPQDRLVHELFEAQVERAPNEIALVLDARSFTYAELNEQANRLAWHLRERGVGPDRRVGICVERSPEMVIGLLAIMKSGATYVPLDPNYPSERLQYMIEDAAPEVVLTQSSLATLVPTTADKSVLLDVVLPELSNSRGDNLASVDVGATSASLVYVIYTSGSTGQPKGTGMPHRAMVNLIEWHRSQFADRLNSRVLQFAALSFDVAFQEIFSTLCTGGTLVLLHEWMRRDVRALISLLSERRIERLFMPPLMLQTVAEGYESAGTPALSLKDVITAGEQLRISPQIVSFFERRDGTRLHNHYGPTETHVVTSLTLPEDVRQWPTLPTIGRPIANTHIYILDTRRQPVVLGAVGEIYIGGANVARGYLHRDELTAQRFIDDPFAPGERVYKTGDVGRWLPDGTIEYLGRNDDQVKIRGFRIELGEIESQLALHPNVRKAAVIAREDAPGQKRLVAYVIAHDAATLSTEALRTHLQSRLPEHMVPSAFVPMETFPTTPSGKLDRRALPAPELDAYVSREYEAPRGEVEEVLANIWQELLGVKRVGRLDNFFELGGHSLLIVQMMERLRRVGLTAEVRRVFDATSLADLASVLTHAAVDAFEAPANLIPSDATAITPEMLSLVTLESQHIARIAQSVPGGIANIQDIYPLAPLQEGILFHHMMRKSGADGYAMTAAFLVPSRERVDQLVAALQAAVDRHDVLRTAVLWEDLPRPVQVVYRRAQLPMEEFVLEADRDATVQIEARMEEGRRTFDLRRAPLVRLQIAKDPRSEQWYLIRQLHHIVDDGMSGKILATELLAHIEGRAQRLPKPVPYRNYVAHALHYAKTHDVEAFFRGKLGDVDEPTAAFGLLDVHQDGTDISEVCETLATDLSLRARAMARRQGVSVAAVFHAAWSLVVASASGRDDVVFGTVLLGRLHGNADTQRMLGLFINTLPLRLQLQDISAKALIERTQRELVELLQHEQASLAIAQRCSSVNGSVPLFNALLNYRHGALSTDESARADDFEVLGVSGGTNYPITLSIDDLGEKFMLTAQTDRRIDPARITAYLQTAMSSLLRALEEAPQTAALALPVLPEAERRQIDAFNATETPFSDGALLHEMFEAQVERAPNAVALVFEGESLTYGQLNARANQLARHLETQCVGPDQIVGLCVDRSFEMVVGLLGILKAGGAYVPLDPSYPADRLSYMLEDAAPRVVLTQSHLRTRLPATASMIVELDGDWQSIAAHDDTNIDARSRGLHANHLAYVIYTSGSTGRPKGAMNEHQGVINRLEWMQQQYQLGAEDRVLQKTPYSFDVSVWEFFWTLMSGARLVIARPDGHKDPRYLRELIEETGVTTLHFVPSMLQLFLEQPLQGACPSLRHIVCSGEELTPALQNRCLRTLPQVQLSNLYGPTEAAVDVTYWECTYDESLARVPIGRPISNLRMHVLSPNGEPVPVGVVGELFIAGVGVGRGYLNRPELTEQRFTRDPFSNDPRSRMYKTGDLGRWRSDGAIEYLGRNDHQVKIRGFRIELGEIESQIKQDARVKDAVVIAREDVAGEKRLVAYLTSRDGEAPTVEELRSSLRTALPDYMVPSAFVTLDELPLTASGKLDRRALPAPELDAFTSREYEAPQGDIEEILAGIWQELLRAERVGRNDNFFELGGHSLLIMQLVERLRRVGLATHARRVFDAPVLAELAQGLTAAVAETVTAPPNLIPRDTDVITPDMLPMVDLEPHHIELLVRSVPGGVANIQDIYPLAPLQEGILFHHMLGERDTDAYVVPVVLSIDSRERLEQLRRALQAVIDRHDVLRTAIVWDKLPQPVQVVYRQATLAIEQLGLDSTADVLAQVKTWVQPERQRMDVTRAPLLRLQVAKDPHGDDWYALLQFHHIAVDHVTFEIIMSEAASTLTGRAQLLIDAAPYREHVARALTYAKSGAGETFFHAKLSDVSETTAPFELVDVHGDGSEIEEAQLQLDEELSRTIRETARRSGVSAATLFHAAYGIVMARTSGRDDVVFGTVLLGRLQGSADAQRTLGMFINTLPVRLSLTGLSVRELVERTQRELIELLPHEQASLAVAQRCSGIEGSAPLFSSLLNYRHSAEQTSAEWLALPGIEFVAIQERTNYPVALAVDDLTTGFSIKAQTDRRIDPKRMTGYLLTAVQALVLAMRDAPQTSALNLPIVPAAERNTLLGDFNGTHVDTPSEKLLHDLFEAQVARTPDALAVVCGDRRLTFAQLDRRASQIAQTLRRAGVGPDRLVALFAERSVEMVAGILGVWKAGAAYVPLDPESPRERLGFMLLDCAPAALLVQSHLRARLPESSVEIIALEPDESAQGEIETPRSPQQAGQLAYVIYTSGSTGRPKGVMIEHRGVVNLWRGLERMYGRGNGDRRVAWNASFTFDASVQQIVQLLSGRTLFLVPQDVRRDATMLLEFIEANGIEGIDCTPSQLRAWVQAGLLERKFSLRTVLVGGEALDRALWDTLASSETIEFFNVYGPTECVVDSTAARINGDRSAPHIGGPMQNRRIYILDRDGALLPLGAIGEIYIGGEGIARGYLNRPDLTTERFVADPFVQDPNARMYRTGDVGRWTSAGVIEYLGRNDHQVKVRGYRIELSEIEAQLARIESVKQAVVLAREDSPGDQRLVAYVVARDPALAPSVDGLKARLKEVLPEYMVPSAFVMLDALPINTSGKVDRRALPAPELAAYSSREYSAPEGDIEAALAELWSRLLGVERVGRLDNFFELGGHSLLGMKLTAAISARFEVTLSVAAVFRHPTVVEMSHLIESLLVSRFEPDMHDEPSEDEEFEEGVLSIASGDRR